MSRDQYLKDYCKQYHKEHYVSNTSKRDLKTRIALCKLLATLAMISKRDGGKEFSAKMLDDASIESLLYDGWSDALVINQENLSSVVGCSRAMISKYLDKAEALGYIKQIGKYRLQNAKYDSSVYIIDVNDIFTDFADVLFDDVNAKELSQAYYDNLHDKEGCAKNSVALNNKCMKQALWQDLKSMIDEFNSTIPEKFKIHFMTKDENGDYKESRYYSCLCKSFNPERHPDESNRYDLLREMFCLDANVEFEELDVNSMMLRTSYNLINDEYLANDADIYYELYKKMVDNPMDYTSFKNEARTIIKQNIMPIYMDPRSVYCKITNVEHSDLNVVKQNYEFSTIEKLFKMTYSEFLTRLKEALYQFLAVYNFDGDKRVFFGQMFFKYEAIVYYYMNKAFRDLDIKSANVFDGFYFVKGTCSKEKFYEVYNEAITKAKDLLKKHNHDLVSIYGKTFELKHRIYTKKTTVKRTVKSSYDLADTPTKETSENVKFLQSVKDNKELEQELIESGKIVVY